ncbi:uncharacterized protein Z519_07690 [Cladophialophora bantiana CBS 173.52]|uniref:Uncharacterized protein n=1 Tax=Cladophialophora bantiana (strain ATCC 10958 / CBS 173.52 / CDC B-1940 / NIH 8579) TaxID=1442370 RepID=A0A0D2FZ26_CLAB1|nr:uncharacterized protein Z519_07690 [Cladophialophora bantiana CBS 173.52]KIW91722.1 hypothetical protein Z519_07690 [Cladophialophora bantiana CBS 173.52]
MDKRPSTTCTSYDQSTLEEHAKGSPSDSPLKEPQSIGFGLEDPPRRSPAPPHEPILYDFAKEGEEIDPATSTWAEDQSSGGSPTETGDQPSQDEAKGKEREMSYPGDYYHHSRASASPSDRRPDISRTSPSSSASTPRQGSEAPKGDDKKDDRTGSGGGSGSGSGSGSASASASGSGSSRSRLVAGVFVRY